MWSKVNTWLSDIDGSLGQIDRTPATLSTIGQDMPENERIHQISIGSKH